MERRIFLETQLWLCRVDTAEFAWPTEAHAGHRFLLPPVEATPWSGSQRQSAPQASPLEPLSCSACFHTGARICFFRTTEENEDQTVLQVELVAAEKTERRDRRALFIRFDGRDVFEISLAAVRAIMLPKDPVDSDTASCLPPYGALDFGSVSMRLWLDPQDTPTIDARNHLAAALRHIEILRLENLIGVADKQTLGNEDNGTWKNFLRYNRWIARADENTAMDLLKTSQIMVRGLELFTSDADKEALKMVLKNACRQRRRCTAQLPYDSATAEDQEDEARGQEERDDDDTNMSPREYFEVVTSMIHVFGEDNASLRRLLGVSPGSPCAQHDNCVAFNANSSQCTTRKWDALDDFLSASTAATEATLKRQRISHEGRLNTGEDEYRCIQKSAAAFRRSIAEPDEAQTLQLSQASCAQQLSKLEVVAFAALFPADPSKIKASVRTQTATEPKTGPPGSLEFARTEHMYKFLLESHRSLVRHELAVRCLPHRVSMADMATPSPNGSL